MNIIETFDPPTESQIRTAGLVLVIKTLWDGDTVEGWLNPLAAVDDVLFSPENGSVARSARIVWGNVSPGNLDASGGGLSVEWSTLRKPYDDLGIIG